MNGEQASRSRLRECEFCYYDASRVLLEDRSFYVYASLGQVVEGYLLINSRTHYGSCAELSSLETEELLILKTHVRRILSQQYGGCIFFEHGRMGHCEGRSSSHLYCTHAHMHCVPTLIDLVDDLREEVPVFRVQSWEDIRGWRSSHSEYLYYEDPQERMYLVDIDPTEIQPRFFRTTLAEALGEPYKACWRNYPGWREIQEVRLKLGQAFAELHTTAD